MSKLLLIDGHALMFRMYYAFLRRPMINSKGEDTSVIFGFTKYLLEIISKEGPTHAAVAFDPPCKTFRHEASPLYKANREATPEVIKESFEPLVEIVRAMDIPVLLSPGYEADDVIGTVAKRWAGDNREVIVVSPDKDFGQIVDEHIVLLRPGKSGMDNEVLGRKEVCEKYGISDPKAVIDILAIWGDAADNVQGVKGIGEVGAKKLISRYGSVEEVLLHLDELTPKQAASLKDAEESLKMSKFLVTIKTDVPLEIEERELRLNFSDTSRVRELLVRYECPSLMRFIPSPETLYEEGSAASEGDDASAGGRKMPECKIVEDSMSWEKNSSDVTAVALRMRKEGLMAAVRNGEGCLLYKGRDMAPLRGVLENERVEKIGFDLKSIYKYLSAKGVEMRGALRDIELMHYLVNPEVPHKMELLLSSFLGINIDALIEKETGDAEKALPEPDLFSEELPAPSAATDKEGRRDELSTILLLPLYDEIKARFDKDPALWRLYEGIEMPLIGVLGRMEMNGVTVDLGMLADYGRELGAELLRIEEKVREEVGEASLNISSPMQLGAVLFDKMKLNPKAKKNSRGNYTTDEDALMEIIERHPVVSDILRFRAVKKLVSTYIDPFPALVDPIDGKVHTTFNQALTATGRLSSVRPNLQNIPIRSEMGKEIRRAFVASGSGNFIVSADYSQIELRLMAHISGDESMIDAFRRGCDIHTSTAAKVFKVNEDEVTAEQRGRAKSANFGIIYGISPFGLAQRLGISRKESRNLIDEYFKSYPAVAEYIESAKAKAREYGYVETMFGRRRYLKDINSKNSVVRSFAERNAVNAPIQGSAADIIKMAMINVDRAIAAAGLQAKMILQVHDELVFDVPEGEVEILMTIVRREMESVVRLSIPLTVECNSGHDWLSAH